MRAAAAVAELRDRLAAAGVATPQVDAELLVRHVLGWSRSAVVLRGAEALPPAAAARLDELAQRRADRVPLQLIVGTVGFRNLDLLVEAGVFVPRPETEVLAGGAIARVPPGGVVVEPCTGSGAVACAVASEVGRCTVVATDVSPSAVSLARRNAQRAQVDVLVVEGDLLEPVPARLRGAVDVVVCNPPYLTPQERTAADPEVRQHDPEVALVAGPTGHEVTDRLIADACAWLRPGGWLLVETDSVRAGETARRAAAAGYAEAVVLPDLTGRDRVVVARRR